MAPVITTLPEILEGIEDRIALARFEDPSSERTSFSVLRSLRPVLGGTVEHLGVSVLARRSEPMNAHPARRLDEQELEVRMTYIVQPNFDQRSSRRGLEQAIDLLTQAIGGYQVPSGMPPRWESTDRDYSEVTGEVRVVQIYRLARFTGPRRGMRR